MVDSIDIDVDVRGDESATGSIVGDVGFDQEVKFPSENSRKSDPDGFVICDTIRITQAGGSLAIATTAGPDGVLIHTEPDTESLIDWLEDNAESP